MNQEQVIRSFYDAVNRHDFEKLSSFFADNGEFRDISLEQVYRGRSEIRSMGESWLKAVPDMKLNVLNIFGSGDVYCVELSMAGTHKGPLEVPTGSIPATGKQINVPSCDVIRLKNGKIESLSCYFASTVLLSQIGAMPLQKAA